MINIQLRNLPRQLQAELATRLQYDPQYVQQQQDLQAQFGPKQYAQQLQALQQLDPTGTALRTQLGQSVASNLALGTQFDPKDVQAYLRGRAAATGGSELGNAADISEIIGEGQYGQQLLHQRQQAAQQFMYAPTPEQQIQSVAPVQPATAFQFVNPTAGLQGIQAGQQQYANQLAAWQASGGGANQTAGLIGGIAGTIGGAYLGTLAGNPVLGAQVGGSLGGYTTGQIFSDARKKNHIEYVGRSPNGHPIFEFQYDDIPNQTFRGTVAQELLRTAPNACTLGADGFWRVDYNKIDIKLEQLPTFGLVEAR